VVHLHHLPSRPLLAVLATAALAVAACGNSDKNEYVKSLNKAEAALQKNLSSLGGDIGAGSSPKQIAAKLDASGQALDNAAKDFNGITPPDNAKHAHGQFIDGLHKLAGTFHGAAKQAKTNDLTGLSKTLTGLQTSPGINEIQDAQNELKANGYKVEDT
jgi:hypothetical protein